MCARRPALEFSKRARRDVSGILLYSPDTSDEDHALDVIRDQPQMGTPRPEIGQGMRSHIVRHHVIVDRVVGRSINVMCVLHEQQIASIQLDDLD